MTNVMEICSMMKYGNLQGARERAYEIVSLFGMDKNYLQGQEFEIFSMWNKLKNLTYSKVTRTLNCNFCTLSSIVHLPSLLVKPNNDYNQINLSDLLARELIPKEKILQCMWRTLPEDGKKKKIK